MKSMKPKVYKNGNTTVRLGWTKDGYEILVDGKCFHRGYNRAVAEHLFQAACRMIDDK